MREKARNQRDRARSSTLVGALRLGALAALGACPTRGSITPDESDAATPTDATSSDARDEGGATDDGDTTDDGATPTDVAPDDAPRDAPPPRPRPPCMPITPAPRTDPCPGRADCGLSSHGRLEVSGVATALTDFQVRVVLPPTVRAAAGAQCDRLVFRTMAGVWAPHFVTDCAMGVVWVRVPALAVGSTTLLMHYGGATAAPAAQSYDDTFDRVPLRAAGTLGAYSFDEGTGTRTCPTVGTTPFDAFLRDDLYGDAPPPWLRGPLPALWSTETPPSPLAPSNPAARFQRNQRSLNFPSVTVTGMGDHCDRAAGTCPDRPVNWQSPGAEPWNTARMQLTVGVWTRPESPSNQFRDNFQTVVCFGMPNAARRAAHWRLPDSDPRIIDNAIFNPWAIFFRGDEADDTLYQGNTCVEPCLDVIQYAHITTTEPQTGARYARQWHFLAFTFDATTTPHTTRRSYYDDRVYEYPRDLELFPQDRSYCPMPLSFAACNPPAGMPTSCAVPCAPLCPGGRGPCIFPPDAPIAYPPAPVIIGADMNDGDAQLGLHGEIDDMFIIARAIGPAEMRAYREHRQYSPDPISTTVTP